MLKIYNTQKDNRKIKVLLSVIIVFTLIILGNKVNAVNVTISGPSKVNVGDTATVIVDFGTYVGAYDLFELTHNSRILSYTGTENLVSKYWFDTSAESTGIRYKTFTFKALKNGTVNIGVKVKNLVSANKSMDILGDFSTNKIIVVGNGIEAGDINNDGYINSTDAAIVLDLYKNGGVTQLHYERADVNGDNVLNSVDAAMILDIFKSSNN